MTKVVIMSDAATTHVKSTARVKRKPTTMERGSFFYHSRLPPSSFVEITIFLFFPRNHVHPPVLRSISTPFRLYLGDSLVGAITYLTSEISARARVSSPEFPREKRTRSLVAGAPDAARYIRSSLIQPLLRSRRNSWLIRSHSAERTCFRQLVISNSFWLAFDNNFHISLNGVPIVEKNYVVCMLHVRCISYRIISIK